MAQSQQTYQPYFQKGQCVNYEYSYKVICRNIADGKTNNTINGYQLLQADNMNNIFERAKPEEVWVSPKTQLQVYTLKHTIS